MGVPLTGVIGMDGRDERDERDQEPDGDGGAPYQVRGVVIFWEIPLITAHFVSFK